MIKEIKSTSNQLVKDLVKLKKRSVRDENDIFLVEGYRPIQRALSTSVRLEQLYFCREWFLGKNEDSIIKQTAKSGARITELSKSAFAKVAYRKRPEGLIAVCKQWHTKLDDLKLSKTPFIIIVQAIEKPGNLGTILRSADATGVEAVIICDPVTDVFNPNVVRASTGTLFSVPVIVTNSDSAINFCKDNSIKTVASTPHSEISYTKIDMNNPIALVVGSEQFGLSDALMSKCDIQVKIPMSGIADSLNVSAATVVLAYEVLRQRTDIG